MPIARRVAAAALVVAAIAGGCSASKPTYGRSTEVPFMAACGAGQPDAGEVCKCTYTEITRTIAFDHYLELDRQMQDDPKKVPDEILNLAIKCALRSHEAQLPFGFGSVGGASDSSS